MNIQQKVLSLSIWLTINKGMALSFLFLLFFFYQPLQFLQKLKVPQMYTVGLLWTSKYLPLYKIHGLNNMREKFRKQESQPHSFNIFK